MKEKCLVNVKSVFFQKITLFFKNIFKNKKVTEMPVENSSVKENTQIEDELSDSLQELVVTELSEEMKEKIEEEKIEKIMQEIGNNKDELRKLDIKTLKKITKYYNKKINKLSDEIKVLKSNYSAS